MPGPKSITPLVAAAIAVAFGTPAAAVAFGAPAAANPGGPCEEVVYVGTCDPVGSHGTTSGPPHSYGEHAIAPVTGNGAPSTFG